MIDFDTPEQLSTLRTILKGVRWARPILDALGVRLDQSTLDAVIKSSESLLEVAEFNKHLLSRGWIAHPFLDAAAAQDAVQAAKSGNFEQADDILIRSHSAENLRIHIKRLMTLNSFRRRVDLARLAVQDYEAKRYHACVPVTLALLDGMGQELTGAGFFRQGVRFIENDSFLDLGPGLAQVIRLMNSSRGGTTTAEISIPYRNGILHGVDLGYATPLVAAKAWGALLAVGSYAQERLLSPKPTDDRGLQEKLADLAGARARIKEVSKLIAEWHPRSLAELDAALSQPMPTTPESALNEFVESWRRGNYSRMAQLSRDSGSMNTTALAGRIKKNLGGMPAVSFVLVRSEDHSSALTKILVRPCLPEGEDLPEVQIQMGYYCDDTLEPRNMVGGVWLVDFLWPLEAVQHQIRAIKASRRT